MQPEPRRMRSRRLLPAYGRKQRHRFRFVPANRSHRALSGINMRVIKQKPRTVFSARLVCSGLPLTQTNENDFLAYQKREPNSLQPAKEMAAKRVYKRAQRIPTGNIPSSCMPFMEFVDCSFYSETLSEESVLSSDAEINISSVVCCACFCMSLIVNE